MIHQIIVVNGKICTSGNGILQTSLLKERLDSPTVSKSGNILTIGVVLNATSFIITQNAVIISTIPASQNTFDLNSISYPAVNGTIQVTACDDNEVYYSSLPTSLGEPFPTEVTDTPTSAMYTLSSNILTIDTSSINTGNNVIVLSQNNVVKSKHEFPVATTTIDLDTFTTLSGETLPDGLYDVFISCNSFGKAYGEQVNIGKYRRGGLVKVALDKITYSTGITSIVIIEDLES